MKKILAILLATILSLGTLTVFANEETRPSISISSPSERLVKKSGEVAYTITFADTHGEEVVLNPSLLTETFNYTERQIIKVKPNCYDLIYTGVNTTGINRIKVLKGGDVVRGLETYESPNSESFFIFDENTTRKDIADYLLRIVGDDCQDSTSVFNDVSDSKYNKLFHSSLMFGDGNGSLLLGQILNDNDAYLINRRINLMK